MAVPGPRRHPNTMPHAWHKQAEACAAVQPCMGAAVHGRTYVRAGGERSAATSKQQCYSPMPTVGPVCVWERRQGIRLELLRQAA